MFEKRKSALPTIALIGIISFVSFKDMGIFIKEFVAIGKYGSEVNFKAEEITDTISESDKDFIIEKDLETYQAPKDTILKTEKTFILGTVKINKTLKGEDNSYYVLVKDEPVLIKDFKDGKCTIVNENGDEFQVDKDYIDLRNSKSTASRSGLSKRTSTINIIIQKAHETLGKPYRNGGIGPNSYDCSGLTYSLYLNHGEHKLNRSSKDQAKNGIEVKKSELIPGDLIFFRTYEKTIGHVGLYIGDGNMIHASSGSKKVIITPIDKEWYKKRYVTARRIIN